MTALFAPATITPGATAGAVLLPAALASIKDLVLQENEALQARTLLIELGEGHRVELYGRAGRVGIKAGRLIHRVAFANLINHYMGWLLGGDCPGAPDGLLQVRHLVDVARQGG